MCPYTNVLHCSLISLDLISVIYYVNKLEFVIIFKIKIAIQFSQMFYWVHINTGPIILTSLIFTTNYQNKIS